MSSTEARAIHHSACFAGSPAPTWIALAFRLWARPLRPQFFSGFKHHAKPVGAGSPANTGEARAIHHGACFAGQTGTDNPTLTLSRTISVR
ncbi:hypothetical protein D3C75_656870 [compost metagenome]